MAKPEKIILFGSAARGEMGLNSDVDLLVVKKGKFDRSRIEPEATSSRPRLSVKGSILKTSALDKPPALC